MTEPEEKMIVRIQKLLERASHPGTPEHEAEAMLAKADDLMVKYSIDQALLNSTKSKEEKERPERRDVEFFSPTSPLRGALAVILEELAKLTDVKVVRLSGGKHAAVGFAADIDYLELVFLGVRNQFQQKMFPKWDPDADLDQNIYNFKVAGYKWIDIYQKAVTTHATAIPFCPPPRDGGAMIRAYKRHAKKIGDERKISTQRFDAYRKSYAAGFVATIEDRVRSMTKHRRAEEATGGTGAEVALRDRRQDVLEAFYTEFPELRPKSPEQLRREAEEARRAYAAEQEALRQRIAAMTPKQRDAYFREQERKEREYARWNAEWQRRNRTDAQGWNSGSRAAAQADLSGGRNTVGGMKRELG